MNNQEYVRSINGNYERFRLEEQPADNSFQYCILTRGGIKGLLQCSIRNIDGVFYTYYDISSYQNIKELLGKRVIKRDFLRELFEAIKREYTELGRFLLDRSNLILYPDQIFKEVETGEYAFLYIPYSEDKKSFKVFTDYLLERIDYDDDKLVEFTYRIYERFERCGDAYLKSALFDDCKILYEESVKVETNPEPEMVEFIKPEETPQVKDAKKSGISALLSRKNREKDRYREKVKLEMLGLPEEEAKEAAFYGFEEENSDDNYGKTIYLGEYKMSKKQHYLKSDKDESWELTSDEMTIGKRKEDCKIIFDDISVSRIHARIMCENEEVFLEDMNSTNGTFKNGVRLVPYERKRLEMGDELRFGNIEVVFN